MNVENIKDKLHRLQQDSKKLTMEVASSSGTLTPTEIEEMESAINAIRSNVEYLKSTIRGKRERVLNG